jgi:hypothetical protein
VLEVDGDRASSRGAVVPFEGAQDRGVLASGLCDGRLVLEQVDREEQRRTRLEHGLLEQRVARRLRERPVERGVGGTVRRQRVGCGELGHRASHRREVVVVRRAAASTAT